MARVRYGATQCVGLNLPAMIVDEPERAQFHVVNRGKKFEERIARLRDRYFVVRLAQQAKEERVCLTRARSKDQTLHINVRFGIRFVIVLRHSRARFQESFRLRLVSKGHGRSESAQDCAFVILKTTRRRVRGGQIENRLTASASATQSARIRVFFQSPIGALRKHQAMPSRRYSN